MGQNLLTKGIGRIGQLLIGGQPYGVITVCNKTGSSIAAGKLVYISGYDGTLDCPSITLADADTSAKVAQFVTKVAIAANARGLVYEKYEVGGLNTNAGSVGDPVYLSSDAGAWTLSALSGADQVVQIVGFVTAKSTTVGKILFLLQPRNVKTVGSSALQTESIINAKLSTSAFPLSKIPTNLLKFALAVGTAGGADVTVSGMVATNEILFVGAFTTLAAITTFADRTAEYAAGAGKMTKAAGTNETNNQLLVIWVPRT